jgi:predicted nucleic acid-binding protein
LARRGRPPLERGIVPCDVPALTLPDRVLLDTAFVVDALLSDQRYHAECSSALVDLALADVELVYSTLVEVELLEAVYKVALRERYGDWRKARPDGRARRRVARIAESAMEAWDEIVDIMGGEPVEPSQVAIRVPGLMHRYGLRSYDAVHVATAIDTETRAIYTLDAQFARVPAKHLTLYTVSAKVPRMRKLRS